MQAWRRFISFWMYPAIAAVLLAGTPPSPAFPVLFAAGLLSWTLLEYVLHRFIFHGTPRNPLFYRLGREFHRAHHRQPRDPAHILARPRMTLPLSALIWAGLYGATGSAGAATGVMAGVWTGFLYYEWVHYRVHTSGSTFGVDSHRRRHFSHHFVDETTCFGVTSPLWDRVFGTDRRSA